jgi:hypothetical protein
VPGTGVRRCCWVASAIGAPIVLLVEIGASADVEVCDRHEAASNDNRKHEANPLEAPRGCRLEAIAAVLVADARSVPGDRKPVASDGYRPPGGRY